MAGREVLALSVFLAVSLLSDAAGTQERYQRLLPGPSDSARCDPTRGNCRKGDWVAESIADCKYDRGWLPPYTCSAIDSGGIFSWVVQPDKDDKCKPASGKRIRCGDPGTNTRCVCSDYKIKIDKCICQYWTEETPGEDQPAFCTAYYLGGTSGVHHWACCNNCNDPTPNTCDGHTYQTASDNSYCGSCGENTARDKGQKKYYFSCGSCEIQSACESRCSYIPDIPGFCWKWVDCFYGCCRSSVAQPSKKQITPDDIDNMEFCGDYNCTGSETPSTCPGDCCYQANSLNCSSDPSTCTPDCCQMEGCCLDAMATGRGNTLVSSYFARLLSVLVIMFLVLL